MIGKAGGTAREETRRHVKFLVKRRIVRAVASLLRTLTALGHDTSAAQSALAVEKSLKAE